MANGLLWFDDRKNISTEQKILDAVLFYQQKFGVKPDCCYLNPLACDQNIPKQMAGLRIEIRKYVLPNHFLLEKEN